MLSYDDEYVVELHDFVEAVIDGASQEGQVTTIHPRLGMVTVRYDDFLDLVRSTGCPRTKSRRVAIDFVSLLARDG